MKVKKAFLVYQAGIANVFSVDCFNLDSYGRNAERLYQGTSRDAFFLAKGLGLAGAVVRTASCNQAGDIANMRWTDGLEDCPFRDQAFALEMN